MKHKPAERYSTTPIFESLETGHLGVHNLLAPRRMRDHDAYIEHIIQSRDRLDRLAAHDYGDPRMWWLIAQANAETLLAWGLVYENRASERGMAALRTGKVILIPRPSEAAL